VSGTGVDATLAPGTERGAASLPLAQKIAVAASAAGLLALALAFLGLPIGGGWVAIGSSLGLASVGASVAFWLARKDETPGIKNHGVMFRTLTARGALGWALGILFTGFYVVLYFYEDLQARGLPKVLDGGIALLDPLARLLSGHDADKWFLYGTLYTLAILVMGVRMQMKYRHNRYQQIRTFSVMFFQLGFAFLVPSFLKLLGQPEYYFTYFWPLKPWYGWPDGVHFLGTSGIFGLLCVAFGTFMILVATPLLTWRFGKRWYCSWVCGCGGLAETLGDPWRQNSDKSLRAWKLERWSVHGVLVAVVVATAILWINSARRGEWLGDWSSPFAKAYGFYIGAIFSGVVGVGFYPILGSRVWCRFGCPMAAILGIFQRFWSRFRITTNGAQCISCGNCSTYCEMGIDVRWYAQREENIVRASCVGCGVCAAVCPRGVLSLENGATHGDRFPGSERPVQAFLESVGISSRAP
jgi:Pyruvate/2-oxoacid:ferredoxin oxidoreductase delta subunit